MEEQGRYDQGSSGLLSCTASETVGGSARHKAPLSLWSPLPGAHRVGRLWARPPAPGAEPSPVQIVARGPRGAPGGGEGVLGQFGEAEPR